MNVKAKWDHIFPRVYQDCRLQVIYLKVRGHSYTQRETSEDEPLSFPTDVSLSESLYELERIDAEQKP